jgi:hypothetical protein
MRDHAGKPAPERAKVEIPLFPIVRLIGTNAGALERFCAE